MPCAQIQVSVEVDKARLDALCVEANKKLAEIIGKPIAYCMATAQTVSGAMNGNNDPVAFIRVSSIGGLSGSVPKRLSAAFCALLKPLGIAPDRVYINFRELSGGMWGFDGDTF